MTSVSCALPRRHMERRCARRGRARQPVFVCGHSQGGIVAAALASVYATGGVQHRGNPVHRWTQPQDRVRRVAVTVAITHDQ